MKEIREVSINKVTALQYKQYSTQQLCTFKEAKQSEKNPKLLYHALRLSKECERICSGVPPKVYFNDEEREHFLKIRRNEIPHDQVISEIDEIHGRLNVDSDKLPDTVDLNKLSKWLTSLKISQLSVANENEKLKEKYTFKYDNDDSQRCNFDQKLYAESILSKNAISGNILFVAPYGTTILKADQEKGAIQDYIAVYCVNPTRYYDTLHPVPKVLTDPKVNDTNSGKHHRGTILYEVEDYISQLQKGEHTAVESLFYLLEKNEINNQKCWISSLWQNFIDNTDFTKLMSIANVMHYTGNAESLLKNPKSDKEVRMATKFIIQAQKIVDGLKPSPNYTPEQEDIFLGRQPTELVDVLLTKAKSLRDKGKTLSFEKNTLKSTFNDWVLSLRKSFV
eukprot:TRINITY_DN7843_c0_g1_i4.p1 TRINITY_DN7843_c0_g1~~TRINITY_DN7843_c0_g1_i4.p1  ORF type:complete len:394 (-),score=54.70 TRINITY_DN7843_c0_g1_i4:89-1270(-)